MMQGDSLFCFGLGYCARRLAPRLLAEGWHVKGTVRNARGDLAGVDDHRFDHEHDLPEGALAVATHALISAPPDNAGDPVLARCRDQLAAAPKLRWIGYLSTTGVYGDRQGGWVDEETAVDPNSERSRKRVEAEQAWRDFGVARGVPIRIFRLAGIYGPGRSVFDDIETGTARRIKRPGHVFSRIHVDDVAQIIAAAMNAPSAAEIFNLCDDEPAEPAAVLEYACTLLGIAPPPEIAFDQVEFSPMARSFWNDNKRVRNDRIKSELGIKLLYPSYREGLKSLHEAGDRASG